MEHLIKEAKRGNPDAFTKLMEHHMQAMYKTARSLLQSDDDCADAISETILICWQKLPTLRVNAYFKTWMIRILINECKDIRRTNRNLRFLEEVPELVTEDTQMVKIQHRLEFEEALDTIHYELI